jgi:hypothetical protein
VVALSAAVLSWGMVLHAIVRDEPRQWDFGALPDVPGQSVYSTATPPAGGPTGPAGKAPLQMAPLPEARPVGDADQGPRPPGDSNQGSRP